MCAAPSETTFHLLFECPYLLPVEWPLRSAIQAVDELSFITLLTSEEVHHQKALLTLLLALQELGLVV